MKKLSRLPEDILALLKEAWWEGYDAGQSYGYAEAEWDNGCAHNLEEFPQYNSNPYAKEYNKRRAQKQAVLEKVLLEIRGPQSEKQVPYQPNCHNGVCFFCKTEVDEYGCDCTGNDSYA